MSVLCLVVEKIAIAAISVIELKIDGNPWLVHRGLMGDA